MPLLDLSDKRQLAIAQQLQGNWVNPAMWRLEIQMSWIAAHKLEADKSSL